MAAADAVAGGEGVVVGAAAGPGLPPTTLMLFPTETKLRTFVANLTPVHSREQQQAPFPPLFCFVEKRKFVFLIY